MIDNKKINTLFITITLIEIVTIILGFTIGSSFYFCLKEYKKTMNSKRMRNCASKWNANTTKKIFWLMSIFMNVEDRD